MIEIRFNGEKAKIQNCSVQRLLEDYKLANKKVAVEVNKEIIPKSLYSERQLLEGDNIEIVHFVGGG